MSQVASQTVKAARELAADVGLPEKVVVEKVAEGVLMAAKAIGPEAVAEVAGFLPEEITGHDKT